MKLASRLVAAAALSIIGASSANAQVTGFKNSTGIASPTSTITFDELTFTNGTTITNQYAAYGVTFAGLLYTPQSGTFPGVSGNDLGNFFGGATTTNPFQIFFTSAQTSAAFGLATNPATTTFTALLAGVAVASFTTSTTFNDGNAFVGFNAAGSSSFDEIDVNVGSSDSFGLIDNIQQGEAVVATPEPASMALVATGLLGLFGVARKRRTNA